MSCWRRKACGHRHSGYLCDFSQFQWPHSCPWDLRWTRLRHLLQSPMCLRGQHMRCPYPTIKHPFCWKLVSRGSSLILRCCRTQVGNQSRLCFHQNILWGNHKHQCLIRTYQLHLGRIMFSKSIPLHCPCWRNRSPLSRLWLTVDQRGLQGLLFRDWSPSIP